MQHKFKSISPTFKDYIVSVKLFCYHEAHEILENFFHMPWSWKKFVSYGLTLISSNTHFSFHSFLKPFHKANQRKWHFFYYFFISRGVPYNSFFSPKGQAWFAHLLRYQRVAVQLKSSGASPIKPCEWESRELSVFIMLKYVNFCF